MATERLLFDTNALVYWFEGNSAFKPALAAVMRAFRKKRATFYVSTVSLQEFLVVPAIENGLERALTLLNQTFSVIPFDERAAVEAATLWGKKPPAPGNAAEANLRHRDVAILGSAVAHDMTRIVTANEKDFAPFRELVDVEIEVIRPIVRRGH